MSDSSSTMPAVRPHRALIRLAGVVSAVIAAEVVWLAARYGAGVHLQTPGFGSAQIPASLSPGFVAVITAAASLLGLAALVLIEHSARRPRRVWVLTGLITLAVSLSAPLSGHGVPGTDRLALIFMHLAVSLVVVPVFALTSSRASSAAGTSTKGSSKAPSSAQSHKAARAADPG